MKKKILAIVLCVAMLAIAIAGGTMAYFTDTAAKTNTFTVGNVDITLYESALHRQNDNATDEQIIADSAKYDEYLKTNGSNMVPGRWVRKAPYVKNTGNNDCYVRIIVKLPAEMDKVMNSMLYSTGLSDTEKGFTLADMGTETIDGVTYNVTGFTFVKALAPNEMTYYAPFWQFQIKPELDNADLSKVTANAQNILVIAQAIQAEGFDTAAAAFAAYDAQK